MMWPARRWLFVAAILGACGRGSAEDQAEGATSVAVTVAPVRRDTISESLTLIGRLDATPGSSVVLAAPVAAVVRRVRTEVGAKAVPADTLIELDAPELAAQARTDAAAATAATRNAARQRTLLAQGIASQRQVEEAENLATAALAARDASARLLARTAVTSPIEGAVQRVAVQAGERVDAGAALLEVMDSDTLDLVVPVPASRLPLVHPGQVAWITAEGDTLRHRAWVQAVAPGIDSVTNAGRVVIRMPNPGGRVHIGAAATAMLQLRTLRNATVLPLMALTLVGDSQTVFTVGADSVARAHVVTVLVRSGDRAAVQGAIPPGARVVTDGAPGLADGMHVVPAAGRE